ncbi:MAG: hypothetical protein AABW56_04860 [Nanoarchaeota archaeon]
MYLIKPPKLIDFKIFLLAKLKSPIISRCIIKAVAEYYKRYHKYLWDKVAHN